MARNPQHAQIQIARKELKLVDDDYRSLLKRVTGHMSSTQLNAADRSKVILELRRLGWQGGSKPQRKASEKPYVRKIFALWGQLKKDGIWKNPDRKSLITFVKKMTDRDDPEWLSYAEATQVIEALKAMQVGNAK